MAAAEELRGPGFTDHGGSSDRSRVQPGKSDPLPFSAGKVGVRFINDGQWSNSINLENGPVQRINRKYGGNPINGNNPYADVANPTANPKYLTLHDVVPILGNWFINPRLGQVWYEKRHNNTEVYSVRQMANSAIPAAPKFGGLVIAKVPGMGGSNGNVFFGEWAPRAGNPPQNSTDLNMGDSRRTVWYVGDNPTTNMPNLVNAQYNVLGVNKHTPGQNDFYTGTLTANYGGSKGSLIGNLTRGSDSIDFAGTNINSRGIFDNGKANEHISGRFYGSGAEALAGIVDRAGVDKDVAFGGRKQ